MKVENPVGDFPHPHSWRSDVRSGHLTMSCQLHSYLHGSITEPGGWACGNFLDLCRHLLGRLSVYSLAPSGNKGQDARGNRGVLSALNVIPAKRNANTRYYGLVSGCGAALGAIKFRLGSVQSSSVCTTFPIDNARPGRELHRLVQIPLRVCQLS